MDDVIVTKEELFSDLESETVEVTEEVWVRGKKRYFKIKPFESTAELEEMTKKIRQASAAASASPLPPYGGMTEGEINASVIISMASVEPKLSFMEVTRIQKKAGPAMMILMGRIMEISGITEKKMQEGLKELEANPFSINGDGPLHRDVSPTPEGNEVINA